MFVCDQLELNFHCRNQNLVKRCHSQRGYLADEIKQWDVVADGIRSFSVSGFKYNRHVKMKDVLFYSTFQEPITVFITRGEMLVDRDEFPIYKHIGPPDLRLRIKGKKVDRNQVEDDEAEAIMKIEPRMIASLDPAQYQVPLPIIPTNGTSPESKSKKNRKNGRQSIRHKSVGTTSSNAMIVSQQMGSQNQNSAKVIGGQSKRTEPRQRISKKRLNSQTITPKPPKKQKLNVCY